MDTLAALEALIDTRTLLKWKAEEAEWLVKVVDIGKHKSLNNLYEPKPNDGKQEHKLFALYTHGAAQSLASQVNWPHSIVSGPRAHRDTNGPYRTLKIAF